MSNTIGGKYRLYIIYYLPILTDPREDREVTWTEGPRLHHSWETEDGQQAVQLPNEDVQ